MIDVDGMNCLEANRDAVRLRERFCRKVRDAIVKDPIL